jgi:hypothetical protein
MNRPPVLSATYTGQTPRGVLRLKATTLKSAVTRLTEMDCEQLSQGFTKNIVD